MEDDEIRTLLTRLARPHASGGKIVERAAILANGADFAAVMEWITAHGGTAEAMVSSSKGGLHNMRDDTRADATAQTPRRFVLPPDALAL
jgi:hypothetical protein